MDRWMWWRRKALTGVDACRWRTSFTMPRPATSPLKTRADRLGERRPAVWSRLPV